MKDHSTVAAARECEPDSVLQLRGRRVKKLIQGHFVAPDLRFLPHLLPLGGQADCGQVHFPAGFFDVVGLIGDLKREVVLRIDGQVQCLVGRVGNRGSNIGTKRKCRAVRHMSAIEG